MKRYLFTASAVLSVISSEAAAQWVETVDTDPFTDQEIRLIRNKGEVVTGTKKHTELIYREKNGKTQLYWVVPDGYICSHGLNVKIRLDKGKPIRVAPSLSTDKTSIFFPNPTQTKRLIMQAEKVALQATDGCGGHSVAIFTGSISSSSFNGQNENSVGDWTLISKTQKAVTGNQEFEFRYKPLEDGKHDASFYGKVANRRSTAVKNMDKSGTFVIDGVEYEANVFPENLMKITKSYGDRRLATGGFTAYFKNSADVDLLINKLKSRTVPVKLIYSKKEFDIEIKDFNSALKLTGQ